jgi:glycosyltransferase involved in cell wall biosynthesis
MSSCKHIGFVIDGLVPSFRKCFTHLSFSSLLYGWPGSSSIQTARFNQLIAHTYLQNCGLHYELFRPWRSYAAVVFLKSMNEDSFVLAGKCQRQKVLTLFDLNVDYLSPVSGTYYFKGMAPTVQQNEQARQMAEVCDAVIADSRWLAEVAQQYTSKAIWIPDCIPDYFFRETCSWIPKLNEPIPLLWSGEAVKLFELLLIEDVLRSFKNKIVLKIVTNSLEAIDRIFQPWQRRIIRLLKDLQVEIIPFQDIHNLMSCYDQGGVFISPRFLDNTYNMGHTEWKITMPMARGRIVLCSPQPSYEDVGRLSGGRGIRICKTQDEWMKAFDEIMKKDFAWQEEQKSATQVVENDYSSSAVVKKHADFVKNLLALS